jgi:hypothetical protein
MKNQLDLNKVELSWCKDILKRIQLVLEGNDSNEGKIESAKWLVKQALKIDREE